ncbi:MAG: ABC transporter permease [Bacteroidota bacterium]
MLKSYVKTASRALWRQKGYSAINITGLAVGLACSFFILLWIQDEVRHDRFHESGEQLHRVMRHAHFGAGEVVTETAVPMPLAEELETTYPEVEHAVLMSWPWEFLLAQEHQSIRYEGRYAGPAFFEIFSYPFLLGDPATALDRPDAITISETAAEAFFGPDWRSAEVIGQSVRVDDRYEATVTGVFERVPTYSSLQFDFILPVEEFIQRNEWTGYWDNNGLRLFVQLREGADAEAVSAKMLNMVNERTEGLRSDLFLQPVEDMYLYSSFENGELVGGRIDYVRIFSLVAVFLLVIACINFTNLATARSAQRAREIGVRKAIGASQGSLAWQFLGESVLTALVAFVLAAALVVLGVGGFNELTGKAVSLGALQGGTWLLFLGIAVGTGLLAGAYPALYLSSFNTIKVLRSLSFKPQGRVGLRRVLVVFQFALSMLLIIGTVTVHNQLDFIRTKNIGLDRSHVVSVPIGGNAQLQYAAFKAQLLEQPGIEGVTSTAGNPLSVTSSTTSFNWAGKAEEDQTLFHLLWTDHDFVETMNVQLAAGRDFSEDFATDSTNVLINETAARAMGLEDPVGAAISIWGREGQVVGVVEDFHMTSLHDAIEPTVIRLEPANPSLYVRIESGRTAEALEGLERVLASFDPAYPFNHQFMDDAYEQMYQSELRVGTLVNVFAILAVLVACLGLFGLASFTAEQRTKEIGIRKVLGATVPQLMGLLSGQFVGLVGVAFVLAAPVGFYAMRAWLTQFAYRIELGAVVFLVAGLAVVAIAWTTVSYQAYRKATANPVHALKAD